MREVRAGCFLLPRPGGAAERRDPQGHLSSRPVRALRQTSAIF